MNEKSPPPTGAEEVVWDLSHLYAGPDDPRLAADREACLAEARELAARHAGRVKDLDAGQLRDLVRRLERLAERVGRITAYAGLDFATRVNDPAAGAFQQAAREFASAVEKEVLFFDLEWAKAPAKTAERLLADPRLARYRHYLAAARRFRPHLLSKTREALLLDLAPVGRPSWTTLFEKVLAAQRFGDPPRTLEEVLTDLYHPDRDTRAAAARAVTAGLRSQAHVLAHVFNTVLADKMIQDRLRRYPSWISSMNLANELDDPTVEALVTAVTGRYDIVRRYYRLKRRLLGLDELFDYDRYAPLPRLPQRRIPWAECRETVLGAFGRFSPAMAETARRFFDEGWIHAPVRPGKAGGAFAHPTVPEVHPYVLVNYTGTARDVETVAHELGHGVHQVLAAEGGYFNSQTPLPLAETASVFGEMLVFQDLLGRFTDPAERLGLLGAKIESVFATVFRQVAMNRFEDRIHTHRRGRGELAPEDFAAHWLETQQAMFGDSVTLTDGYGAWWSYVGHFLHAPGYVYAYAFGELLVLSLYALYRKGLPRFEERYLALLAAGGSDTPYALLRPFGIDLRNPDFWREGLSCIEGLVADLEALAGEAAPGPGARAGS
ncbi:M3 family oligoendopeptidase [Dissulfurirhabdus thermomarina]|uniref:M3 family oligoendopeptidase n=2 Tax=Dissulfurirhabdus thermomarina TaxID=1765737 RepID=A0A6N9TLZ4_DISTH|nr:M3 family oligoendopeptidase [Dissulfurirhabdus thermomarina]NDY42255.1 M3 family oligoendopeptidase [Dissulfurirhabdus thermomarina]NMX22986.1 M3 family oligoendopeptidase [Dissulfurirhabdus thermomarina]